MRIFTTTTKMTPSKTEKTSCKKNTHTKAHQLRWAFFLQWKHQNNTKKERPSPHELPLTPYRNLASPSLQKTAIRYPFSQEEVIPTNPQPQYEN